MSNSKLPYPPFLARVLAWETESSGLSGLGSVRVSSIISSTILIWDLACPRKRVSLPCQTVRVVTTPRLPLTVMPRTLSSSGEEMSVSALQAFQALSVFLLESSPSLGFVKEEPRGYGQLWLHTPFPATLQPSSIDWSWGRVKACLNKAHPAVCW